ncbi:hypothetical protein O181_064692 [Austropuccinia psidii MF-1]|uniref:DUF300-domain-containing protein n=1 Tax=Austropuccinia psidii MF-1 TaxID=1389203 RepID=A0A9Q3ES30_9BASI|nr:hypothetical protein [Austropuccinia psidii MF-1]
MDKLSFNNKTCPTTNTQSLDQSNFFTKDSINWDPHRIGWLIAGSMSLMTIIISTYNLIKHAQHYHRPAEQRQIMRIILMPPVYAVISFFSYRFFRSYTYYSLIETVYEAFAIAAFLFLLVQYIGNTPATQRSILAKAPKRSVPFPFCCWRYRPSKPYFLHTTKWLVLQYCFFRPLITIIGIICEAKGKLCATQYSIYFAQVYLEAFDFIVFSLALYGLMVFYSVTKVQLKGKYPLSKFLTIKGIVFFTFYQGFLFSILEKHGVIHGSQYWTSTNVGEGLQALCTTIEMVFFAVIMIFSFSSRPYELMNSGEKTSGWRSFIHSQNYSDFFYEAAKSLGFFWDYARRKPYTSSTSSSTPANLDFHQAYEWASREVDGFDHSKDKSHTMTSIIHKSG